MPYNKILQIIIISISSNMTIAYTNLNYKKNMPHISTVVSISWKTLHAKHTHTHTHKLVILS